MESFSFYPNQKVKIEGKTLLIEPYRVGEIRDYVAPMDNIQADLGKLMSKLEYYNKENLTLEDIDKMTELAKEANSLKNDAMDISYKIAQLGLKRALYPKAKDLIGSELDEFPEVKIPSGTAPKIVGIMMKLANKDMPKVADTKNMIEERLQKKSGRTS